MISVGKESAVQTSLLTGLKRLPVIAPLLNWQRRWKPALPEGAEGEFHGTGYYIFDPEIPERILDQAIADVRDRPEVTKDLHHGSRVFDGWPESRAIKAIATAPKVLRVLRQFYGREPLPFQTLNFPIGTEQRLHSDTIHFHSDPPTYMCGVWVALEDIDADNGPLVFYPYSHKLPEVTMEDVSDQPGPAHYHKYEDYIERLIAESGLEPKYATLKKGQALVWAANLIHGGSPQRDKSRTRHSQVTHYFFEGCQYYMPLESYGGYRHLRKPRWIR